MAITVYPSTDIHLVRENGGTMMDLLIKYPSSSTITILQSRNDLLVAPTVQAYPAIDGDILHYIRLQPATGTTTGEIWLNITDGTDILPVRVRVYQSINKIWIGNNRATMFKERDNFVTSVYAEFAGLIPGNAMTHVGDITGHHGTLHVISSAIDGSARDYLTVDTPYLDFCSDNVCMVQPWNSKLQKVLLGYRGALYYGKYSIYESNGSTVIGRLCAVDSNVSSYTATTGATQIRAVVRYASDPNKATIPAPPMSGGSLTTGSITVTAGGSGYTTGAVVLFIGDGSGAAGTATVTGGAITAINITNGGAYYTTAPDIVVLKNNSLTSSFPVFTLPYLDRGFGADYQPFVTVPDTLRIKFQDAIANIHRGALSEDRKRNILIWAEGFSSSEQAKFTAIAERIRHQFLDDASSHDPFPLLADSLNFWTCFIPSQESGVTVASYLAKIPSSNLTLNGATTSEYAGYLIQNPVNIVPGKSDFVNQLLRKVGAPNSSPDTTVSGTGATCATRTAALARWNTAGLVPSGSALAPNIDDDVFNGWLSYEQGLLPQTKDTLLGINFSGRVAEGFEARATSPSDPNTSANRWYKGPELSRVLSLDLRRAYRFTLPNGKMIAENNRVSGSEFGVEVINDLLDAAKCGTVPGSDDYNIGSTWQFKAADEGLVLIILNENLDGGTSDAELTGKFSLGKSRLVTGTYTNSVFDITTHTSIPGATLNTVASTNALTGLYSNKVDDLIATSDTMMHELCHSGAIRLKDEYENIDGYATHSASYTASAQRAKDAISIGEGANTTPYSAINLYSAVAPPGILRPIDTRRVKWNWHRIEKASMVRLLNYVTVGGNLEIQLTLYDTSEPTLNFWRYAKQLNKDLFISTRQKNPENRLKKQLSQLMGDTAPLRITGISTTNIISLSYQTVSDTSGSFPTVIVQNEFDLSSGCYIYTARNSPSKIGSVVVMNDGATAPVLLNGTGMDLKKTDLKFGPPFGRSSWDKEGSKGSISISALDGGGGITTISVDKPGKNYTMAPDIDVSGTVGTAPVLKAKLLPDDTSVLFIKILDGGCGYNSAAAPAVKIAGGTESGSAPGTAAVAQAVVSAVDYYCKVNINSGGTGYKPPLVITYPAAGVDAKIDVSIASNGKVNSYAPILQQGSGYTAGTKINVSGLGSTTTAVFNIDQVGSGGAIKKISQDNAGAGFAQQLTWTLLDGTSAIGNTGSILLEPVVSGGSITDIIIRDHGILDYDSFTTTSGKVTIEFDGGGGTGVIATIEKARKIIGITVTTAGSGYLRIPKIIIDVPPASGTAGDKLRTATASAYIAAYGYLMDIPVIKRLLATPKSLNEKPDCSVSESETTINGLLSNPVKAPTNITGLQSKYLQYTVGVFEGAATWNCSAYRATGNSKMRNDGSKVNDDGSNVTYVPFNYPSQYYLVSLFYPDKLGELDSAIHSNQLLIK